MELEIDIIALKRSAKALFERYHGDEGKYLSTFLSLTKYTEKNIDALFAYLSDQLLDGDHVEDIGHHFEPYILLILSNSICCDESINAYNFADYQKKCVALAKLMRISIDAKRYAANYFRNKPAPFNTAGAQDDATHKTKRSKVVAQQLTSLDIVRCCYHLLYTDPSFFKELWDWSSFVEKYWITEQRSNDLQQVYCNHIMVMLSNMNATQLYELNRSISADVLLQFESEQRTTKQCKNTSALYTVDPPQIVKYNFKSDFVTNIEGVLLPIFNKDNCKFFTQNDGSYDKIVKVDSTKVNLRSIALGISSNKAICLSGAVGCGKTTLVEYLARKTGRVCPKAKELEQHQLACKENTPKSIEKSVKKRKMEQESLNIELDSTAAAASNANGFLRIQLGDQTDSKMLLGQYRCTDVPGEFIWLPGVLTQAVMSGNWLLLEDLDAATQDTYTILSGLLENNYLSVPGFRDCVKIEPGFQLFVTVRTNKSGSNVTQKSLYSLLEKYLYTINILPLSRNELCKVISSNYPKLATVANRIVDVFLTFSSGDHTSADNLRQQESHDKADTTENFVALPFEERALGAVPNSGRLVSTRDLIKLCERSNPMFKVTSTECAYFVFQNAVDVFCSYLPQGDEKTKLITSIGAKLGIIQSRCEHFADEYKPDVQIEADRIKVGRAELFTKLDDSNEAVASSVEMDGDGGRLTNGNTKRQKLSKNTEIALAPVPVKKSAATFSFTRLASCILERIAVCVAHVEPVLLVGETGVGKTSAVQYLAERTRHKLIVVNMNNQSDVSDLLGGFKPVDLTYVIAPLRCEFETLFRQTFNSLKNESFLTKFSICYNQGNFTVVIKLMIKVVHSVFEKSERNELRPVDLDLLPRWQLLQVKLLKLESQMKKSINISFAFITGSLVNCIKNGDWILLDEINLASAETLECLSTILEPDGSVVLLEKGDFTPVKRHADFRIFACMNPNTDIGKKDLTVGIRNRFTEFFVDELTTDADLNLLISDYLSSTGIQKKSVMNIVRLYKKLKYLSRLELNDGLGNRPVFSLRTLCRSLRVCAKNLCGSIERNLFESFCMSFLTQLDPVSHNIVLQLIQDALLSNAKAVLKQGIPRPGENYLNFEGYWIQRGPKMEQECSNYILTGSVRENLRDLARIISIGKLPVLLQGPTSAGKTSLIEYVAKRSGNHCLRINNHEHTDLQEYIGTYAADVTGKLSFHEGVLVQAMRNGDWIILDELNLASTDILEALNRVLDDNRELFIPETQTVVKAHPNFMLFATQNPPGLYGGRKTLSRAFKNRFIELHFSEIPRAELEIILEKRCLIPTSYAKKMVMCMSDLQKNRKTTSKNVFTLRDLFRWGNRYTYADKRLLADQKYDWNQHLIKEGYLVLSAKVRTAIEIEIIEETLYRNFRKRIDLRRLFDVQTELENSPVTADIIASIRAYKQRTDIVWTRNMTRMAVLTAKALQFDEPVLLVGPTGCGKTTVCQILASIRGVKLRILNCHMHTEGADFLGGLRPCRQNNAEGESASQKLFEWSDGPLIYAMQEGSYFMADEISLAEDSVLERLNCVLEPERTVLLAEKGGVAEVETDADGEIAKEFVIRAKEGFQFLATMNPGGDFGKKELSPALRNRFTEVWCLPSDDREDLIQIASNCMQSQPIDSARVQLIATYLVDVVLHIRDLVEKFKFSIRDILAWANYMVTNAHLTFAEKAIFGLETTFLDALEMLPHESLNQIEQLKANIIKFAISHAFTILKEKFTTEELQQSRGVEVEKIDGRFGIKPFFIEINVISPGIASDISFLFDAPTTKKNLFRILSALSLKKPVLLEGPPGVGKTSIVESIAQTIGYEIVRINLCEHTDLADLFGTDLPSEDDILQAEQQNSKVGTFVWRDGPLLAALKAENTWILLDELNLAPQSVLEGLNAILDHRGQVYIPELNKTFTLSQQTRIFACQNPLKQGGGRKGLPQSFLNRFNKVYLRKLSTDDLLYVVKMKYEPHFEKICQHFKELLMNYPKGLPAERNLFDLYKRCKVTVADKMCSENNTVEGSFAFDLSKRLVEFSEVLDRGITSMEFGYKGGPFEINLRDILRWCDLLINPDTGYIFKAFELNVENDGCAGFQQQFEKFLLTLYERMKVVYYQRMRSDSDKQYIRNAFAAVFNCDAEYLNDLSDDVALYWTSNKIYLNDIVLQRQAGAEYQMLRPLTISNELSPTLLPSQRQLLKNMAECVHMEKPVLLCGPTDTGKTKLIDTLCVLSNQIYNTDTIDDSVTGSFQQIDLNRHLEEISQTVEYILLRHLQAAIFEATSAAKKQTAKLLRVWGAYNILSKTIPEFHNTSAMSEELVLFRKRMRNLHNVIKQLLTITTEKYKSKLLEQQRLLNALTMHTEKAESLNTGGSFEWVDSKIVKSLKCGQYILLEHVNLCSSAVLDRLNPVFEPNGKLLISEKGVSATDCAEIVSKSANFRAFLTTDPKNGELSRAMRNRCVELALPKESYDVDDLRLIVHSQGISDIGVVNILLAIHRRISEATPINHYTVSHLTQFALLTAAYERIGYATERAIYVSGMEVYVYSANTDLMGYGLDFYQNKLREFVVEESKVYLRQSTKGSAVEDHLLDVALNSSELNDIARIKLQSLPLKILLRGSRDPQERLAEVVDGFNRINFEGLEHAELIRVLVYLMYESSSMADADLRHCHMQTLLTDHSELLELSNALYAHVQKFSNYFVAEQSQLPWNHRLMPRLRDYNVTSSTNQEVFRLSASLLAQLLLTPVPQQTVVRLHQMNVLAYSQAVATGHVTDKLNNAFLLHLAQFLAQLRELLQIVLATAHFQLDSYLQLSTALLWFNRLLRMSLQKLYKGKELNVDLIAKLVLHYQWLDKHLLQKIAQIAPDEQQQHKTTVAYNESRDGLLDYMLKQKQPNNLMRKVFTKELTHFQPYYQSAQIDLHTCITQLNDLLNIVPSYGVHSAALVRRKLQAQRSDAAKRALALLSQALTACALDYKFNALPLNGLSNANMPAELKQALQHFADTQGVPHDSSDGDLDLSALQKTLGELQQLVLVNDTDDTNEPANHHGQLLEVSLLALQEYYLTKALVHRVAVNEVQPLNIAYCESMPQLNMRTWRLVRQLDTPCYEAYTLLWSQLSDYINDAHAHGNETAFAQLIACLNGGYKQLATCQRLITDTVMQQQLSNLAARNDCTRVFAPSHTSLSEVESRCAYEGPALINTLIALLFESNGSLKAVPLQDVQLWSDSLQHVRQLLWHNSGHVTSLYNLPANNLLLAQQSARRLLNEIAYIREVCLHSQQQRQEESSDYNTDFTVLVSTLTEQLGDVRNVTDECMASQYAQYQASMLHALVGAIELCLLTYTPLIDPVEKSRLKSGYIAEDLNCVRTLTTAYDFMRAMLHYKHFGAELYDGWQQRLQELRERELKYSQKLAVRPEECLYSNLVQDVMHFLGTNCEPLALHTLLQSIRDLWTLFNGAGKAGLPTAAYEGLDELFGRVELWLANAQRFVAHTLQPYVAHYQDFVLPLCCAVQQVRFGLEGLKVLITHLQVVNVRDVKGVASTCVNVNHSGRLYHCLANIGVFPSSRYLQIYNVHSSRDILQNQAPIFQILKPITGSELDYFRLLRAKLSELHNRISIAGLIDEASFLELDFAYNVCNQIWQQEEDRRRRQKAEEDSLYVNKARTVCAEDDEELLELQEIEEHFPTSVNEDFGEFVAEDTLEQVIKLEKRKDLKSKCMSIVRDEDYTFIVEHFMQTMLPYTPLPYYKPSAATEVEKQLQLLAPFRERMQVFLRVYSHYRAGLDEWLDEATYNSFCLAVGMQQQLLQDVSLLSRVEPQRKREKTYDFYKDANLEQVRSCIELLARIEVRVDEQLALWPEHASLNDIKRVMTRIRTLPADAPVARFNAGFQILRQKIAQWNEVAHRRNHLRDEEFEVAAYVQQWTKLELQHWRECLTHAGERVAAGAYRYWFFMYNLLQEYLEERPLDSSLTDMKYAEQRFGEGELLDTMTEQTQKVMAVSEVVAILRQFMEAASYGDFHVRQQLLQSFELYLQHVRNKRPDADANALHGERIEHLVAGLRQLQLYFAQFAGDVEEAKRTMRTPIEKKLRQFVKIESYNKDLSYFSMRSNVARVHRQLNKFLKEYRQALQQKITPLFQPRESNNDKDFSHSDQAQQKTHLYAIEAKWFVAPPQPRQPQQESAGGGDVGESLLQRVGRLFVTARHVVRETVTHAVYPQLIGALDVLLNEQLACGSHLRQLNVDRSQERKRQLVEAKHILQQKRKALADLFKTLTQLGISFKAGLMELSLRDDFDDWTMPPFCVRVLLDNCEFSTSVDGVKRALQLQHNLDLYYARCMLKLKLLQRAMLAPLSELGPPNIERIKGYAVDMFLLVQNQRQLLARTTTDMYALNMAVQQLRSLSVICEAAPDSSDATQLEFVKRRGTYVRLRDSICRIRHVGEQLRLLLQCAPEQQSIEDVLHSSTTADCSAPQDYAAMRQMCDELLALCQSTLQQMTANEDSQFLAHVQLLAYEVAHKNLIALLQRLQSKQQQKGSLNSAISHLPCVKAIAELLSLIKEDFVDITADDDEMGGTDLESVDVELENILHAALIAMQKLYKKHQKATGKAKSDEKDDLDEDNESLQEKHLKQMLHANLTDDYATLGIAHINRKLNNVLLSVKHAPATAAKWACVRRVVTLLPLVQQYQLMAGYVLHQQLGAHRVSVKILSAMLSVFVELSTKGFCVPADLMQDEEGQAKQEQQEGEGFGLEDGTGEKDASDKIESEDQLDDAKRPEDRKNEGDKDQNDDCKEEKGIDMSEDFEGKLQDIEKPEDDENDDSGKSEDEEDINKEMGETEEGAEKLDDQIWGDDEEQPEEEKDEDMNEEDDGKGNKDEQDSHNDLNAKNEASKNDKGEDEHDKDGLDATNEPNADDKRKEQQKDIDNMKEPEVDEDQVNPYHNELEEPPEAEDMDLGEMNNGDDEHDEEGDDQQGDQENPFDIDTMKDNMQTPEEEQPDKEQNADESNDQKDDNLSESGSDSEEDEAGAQKRDDTADPEEVNDEGEEKQDADSQRRTEQETKPEEEESVENDGTEKAPNEEKPEEHEQSKDKASKEENVQSVPETEQKGSADQVETDQTEQDIKQDQKLDEQETGEEKDGVGQAENEETNEGHQGIAETKETITQEDRKNERQTQEKRKQGHTNEERTLGEAEKNKLKQLKTIDKVKEKNGEKSEHEEKNDENDVEAEEYQHVKEPKSSDKTTLDNATEEQSKQIKHQDELDETNEDDADADGNEDLMDVDEDEEQQKQNESENLEELQAEHIEKKTEKPSKSEKIKERAEMPQEMEIEGEVVPTMTVPRSDNTTAHCVQEILYDTTASAQEPTAAETLEMRRLYQQQLTANKSTQPEHEDYENWQTISNRMAQNACELCEQLRLILEPTKCTRLKGDYRTGRRINMKKIIPYIASQFRKDKIWLRRTKPAQRDYKITIAIDDSKSMHHNNSKTLTLEAISLVSQALTLLESGHLSIMSFGESPQIILHHTEQFDGPKLVNALNFDQNKTKIAEMLDFLRTATAEEGTMGSSDNGLFENLLLVLSDGRNIFSEGKAKVKNAIKLARLQRIFLVYIIIDNPENKNSILDIQSMEMLPDKSINIKSYLDEFPFPYYVIVRDLNQLPLVLSEAMRQWFELVNSEQ